MRRHLTAFLVLSSALSLLAGCANGEAMRQDAGRRPGHDAGENTEFPDASSSGDAGLPGVDARAASVGAPSVDGEPSADHRRPSWVWTLPDGAAGFRLRLDGGAWSEVPVATRVHTAASDLDDGEHLFEVQARDADGLYGPSGSFTTTVALITRPGDWWWRTSRTLATSPLGHVAAISAHNAYVDNQASPEANLSATLDKVHAAQAAGADLIELDVSDSAGVPRIEHNDTGSTACALLEGALDDPALQAGDQILFLEIKNQSPSEAFTRAVLDLLMARRAAYARAGRPVVLRTFYAHRETLNLARALLDSDEYVLLRPYVRLSVLFSSDSTPERVREASTRGYQMVEFNYRNTAWLTHAALARSLGMASNLWTIPATFGEVYVANARESADAITVDYPIARARSVVQDTNAQLFFDASSVADASATSLSYYRTSSTPSTFPVNGSGQPRLVVSAADGPLFGGRLTFDGSTQWASTYDADARPGEGVFLATLVRFGSTAIADGATSSVVAKTEVGAWGLELYNPSGSAPTVLRFAVRVGDAYQYASIPTSFLSTARAYFITCAYDGDGGVRMWIDNDDANVTIAMASGGIVNNDVPILIGADPQPGGNARYFFQGEIQLVLVQAWGDHS